MALSIKICGLRTPEALDVALESGADLVGFVFFAPSPRHVALGAARDLGGRVKGRAGKVDPIPYSKRPLSDASKTLDDLREGKIVGRVVLTP